MDKSNTVQEKGVTLIVYDTDILPGYLKEELTATALRV
jgi:hypothetical protein